MKTFLSHTLWGVVIIRYSRYACMVNKRLANWIFSEKRLISCFDEIVHSSIRDSKLTCARARALMSLHALASERKECTSMLIALTYLLATWQRRLCDYELRSNFIWRSCYIASSRIYSQQLCGMHRPQHAVDLFIPPIRGQIKLRHSTAAHHPRPTKLLLCATEE